MGWDSKRYSIFRAILGGYLCAHFLSLVPWGAELFSNVGVLSASNSPLIGVFPNVLGWIDTPAFVTGLLVGAAALSVMLAAGYRDRVAAVLLWFVWASLLGRNPLIANPGIPFVGWLLLFHAAVPFARTVQWRLPSSFHDLAWVIMAAGYTFSAVTKLGSASWLDGTAILHVLDSPLARPTFLRDLLMSQPLVLTATTYGVLLLELLALPLALFRKARPSLWLSLVLMHVGILLTVDFADLTIGMLMIHVITFDPAWLRVRPSSPPRPPSST